jgi:hypothetical protein
MDEIGQITLINSQFECIRRNVLSCSIMTGVGYRDNTSQLIEKQCMLRILSQNEDVWKDLVQYREEHLCERNK